VEPLKVVQVGLGPVGIAIARLVAGRPGLRLVGGVDPAPGLAGRGLAEILGIEVKGAPVTSALEQALEHLRPDLVLHATGSFLGDIADQLRAPLERGVSVVSTCEELAYPFYRHPALARELDDLALSRGAVLLGTGVNPGFVMDKLALTLLGACRSARRVRVLRVVDASTRREPLQRKIGAGLSTTEFEEKRRTGRFGHIGLAESAHMLADAMGVPPAQSADVTRDPSERVRPAPLPAGAGERAPARLPAAPGERVLTESFEPHVAEDLVVTPFVRVEAGRVAGIEQSAVITSSGAERVRLELRMYVGARNPIDAVSIEGEPPIEATIAGGVHGDEGTAAVVVNAAGLVRSLHPGLRTMLDVPLRISGF